MRIFKLLEKGMSVIIYLEYRQSVVLMFESPVTVERVILVFSKMCNSFTSIGCISLQCLIRY